MQKHDFACELQKIHGRLVLVAAAVSGDRAEADDIVQEASIIGFRKRTDFTVGTNFAAWMTTIVKGCASNHRRKHTGRRTYAADPTALDQHDALSGHQATPNPNERKGQLSGYQTDFDDEMFRALNELTEQARCCLLLHVVDRMAYADIAQYLDIPQGTAMSHVHRSKKQLRESILRQKQKEVPDD